MYELQLLNALTPKGAGLVWTFQCIGPLGRPSVCSLFEVLLKGFKLTPFPKVEHPNF